MILNNWCFMKSLEKLLIYNCDDLHWLASESIKIYSFILRFNWSLKAHGRPFMPHVRRRKSKRISRNQYTSPWKKKKWSKPSRNSTEIHKSSFEKRTKVLVFVYKHIKRILKTRFYDSCLFFSLFSSPKLWDHHFSFRNIVALKPRQKPSSHDSLFKDTWPSQLVAILPGIHSAKPHSKRPAFTECCSSHYAILCCDN